MYKKYYDEKKIELRAIILVYNQYPNLKDTQKREMAKSDDWLDVARKSLVFEDFVEKIRDYHEGMLTDAQSQHIATRLVNNMPDELWSNVEEWIDGQQISEIDVHGVSIPSIMCQFQDRKIEFLDAIDCLCRWKSLDYKGKDFCKIYFMRM